MFIGENSESLVWILDHCNQSIEEGQTVVSHFGQHCRLNGERKEHTCLKNDKINKQWILFLNQIHLVQNSIGIWNAVAHLERLRRKEYRSNLGGRTNLTNGRIATQVVTQIMFLQDDHPLRQTGSQTTYLNHFQDLSLLGLLVI